MKLSRGCMTDLLGAGLPFTGLSNWRNKWQLSQRSTKTSAKSCIWKKNLKKIAQCLSRGRGRTGWAATLPKDLEVLVEERLKGNQQCSLVAAKANCMLGCIRKIGESRSGGKWVFPLLLGICGAPSLILCFVLHPQSQGRYQQTGKSPDTKVVRGRARLF